MDSCSRDACSSPGRDQHHTVWRLHSGTVGGCFPLSGGVSMSPGPRYNCLVGMILQTRGRENWNPLLWPFQGTLSREGAELWPFEALPMCQMLKQRTILSLNFRASSTTVHDGISRLAGSRGKYILIIIIFFFRLLLPRVWPLPVCALNVSLLRICDPCFFHWIKSYFPSRFSYWPFSPCITEASQAAAEIVLYIPLSCASFELFDRNYHKGWWYFFFFLKRKSFLFISQYYIDKLYTFPMSTCTANFYHWFY